MARAILQLGSFPDQMETFNAEPHDPVSVCEEKVRNSDALVAVIAFRYGWIPSSEQGGSDRKSITWLEVETALHSNRPVFAFIAESTSWEGPEEQDDLKLPEIGNDPDRVVDVAKAVQDLQRFKNWLEGKAGIVVKTFSSPQDLATKVTSALATWAMRRFSGEFHLPTMQERARGLMRDSLEASSYQLDWDVREQSAERELFFEDSGLEETAPSGPERPLVRPRSAVLLIGDNGKGKSWRLYRLGHDLVEQDHLAILHSATGDLESDLKVVVATFCHQICSLSSEFSLRDLHRLLHREIPELLDPWLTVLIDGVKTEEYALRLLAYPWEAIGVRVALAGRLSEHSLEEADAPVLKVSNFSVQELMRYLKARLGVGWMNFPQDFGEYLKLPLFAKLYCDLRTSSTVWRAINEYHLFERVWGSRTSVAPLAASAIARLASRIPEEQVYPWPLAKAWAIGLRDGEVRDLIGSGLVRLANSGRSLEIWHDRILNWAVAEGLVSSFRNGEIDSATLASLAIHGDNDNPLFRRLDYVAMDTLWILCAPELGLESAVAQFLDALEARWQRHQLVRNLATLGPRITPHLIARLSASPTGEEDT